MSDQQQVLSGFQADSKARSNILLIAPSLVCFGAIFLLSLLDAAAGMAVTGSPYAPGLLYEPITRFFGGTVLGFLPYTMLLYLLATVLTAPLIFRQTQRGISRALEQSAWKGRLDLYPEHGPYHKMLFYCLISGLPAALMLAFLENMTMAGNYLVFLAEGRILAEDVIVMMFYAAAWIGSFWCWYKMQEVSASWFLAPEHTFRAAWKRDSGSPQRLRPEKRQRFGRAVWVMLLALVCYAALYTVLRLLFCQNFVPWGLGDYIFTFTLLGMIALWILGAVLIAGAGPFSWGSLKMRAIRMAAESRTLPPQ